MSRRIVPPAGLQHEHEVAALREEIAELRAELEALRPLKTENEALREEIADLRAAVSSKSDDAAAGSHHEEYDMSKLPQALRDFEIFTEMAPIREILGTDGKGRELREREQALESAVSSKDQDSVADATMPLTDILVRLKSGYQEAIKEKLERDGITKQCIKVINTANEGFSQIYESVWKNLIGASEKEMRALDEYRYGRPYVFWENK